MFQLLLQALPAVPVDSIPSPRQELRQLSAMSIDDILSKLANTMISFAASLVIAILVFYAGKFIIK